MEKARDPSPQPDRLITVSDSISEGKGWPKKRRSFLKRLRGGDDEFINIVNKREVPYSLHTFEAGVLMAKAALHGSFLLLPWAYAKTGHVPGVIFLLLIYSTIWYAIRKLVCMAHKLTKRTGTSQLGYGDVTNQVILDRWPASTKAAYATRVVVDIILFLGLFATACLYIVETASFLKKAVQDPCITVWLLCCMFGLLLILLSFINKLKWLVPLCFVGNLCILFGIIFTIVVFYGHVLHKSMDDSAIISNLGDYVYYFGSVPFTVTWIYAILPIENESREPQKVVLSYFSPWLLTVIVIFTLHAVLAFLGYNIVGPTIGANVLVQYFVGGHPATLMAFFLVAIGVFLTINLLILLASQIIWFYLKDYISGDFETTISFVLPPAVMFICVLLSIAFRDYTIILAIIVTLTISLVSFIIPALLHIIIKFDENLHIGWKIVAYVGNVYLIIIGIIVIFCGFITDLKLWKDNKKLEGFYMEH